METVIRGKSFTVDHLLIYESGDPINLDLLTDITIEYYNALTDVVGITKKLSLDEMDKTIPSLGRATVYIDGEDTESLEPGKYNWRATVDVTYAGFSDNTANFGGSGEAFNLI